MTYLDGVISKGEGLDVQYGAYYTKLERLGFVRFYKGLNIQGSAYYMYLDQLAFTDCSTYGFYSMSSAGFFRLVVNHCVNSMYGNTLQYMKSLQSTPSYNTSVAAAYADRDAFRIRSTCHASENLRMEYIYGYTPFKSLHLSHSRSRSLVLNYTNVSPALEVETFDVSYKGPDQGVLGGDQAGYIFHTVVGKQTTPVFGISGGTYDIDSIDNQIQFGSGLSQPGEYEGNYGYSLNCTGGTLTNLSGDFDAKVNLSGKAEVNLKDTTINPADGSSTLFSISNSAILRLKNSGGYSAYNATANSGYIQPDTSYRHTNSGVSWKFYNPGQTTPLEILVGKVAVNSGSQASVSVWGYTNGSSATTDVILRVDGSNAGLGTSLTNDLSSATNSSWTWGEITVNFTPTSAGVVDVYLRYGDGTSNYSWGIFDDMSATQA